MCRRLFLECARRRETNLDGLGVQSPALCIGRAGVALKVDTPQHRAIRERGVKVGGNEIGLRHRFPAPGLDFAHESGVQEILWVAFGVESEEQFRRVGPCDRAIGPRRGIGRIKILEAPGAAEHRDTGLQIHTGSGRNHPPRFFRSEQNTAGFGARDACFANRVEIGDGIAGTGNPRAAIRERHVRRFAGEPDREIVRGKQFD